MRATCRRTPRSSSRPRSETTTRSWPWPEQEAWSSTAAASCWPSSAGSLARSRSPAAAPTARRRRAGGGAGPRARLGWARVGLGTGPAFFVGGEVPGLGPEGGAANAGWGEGEWVVAEVDESDGSFRHLEPEIAVVTNVEMDHHAHWKSLDELTAAFRRLLESDFPCAWW